MFTSTYNQLSVELERHISGMEPGSRLPGVRRLSEDFKASPNTILKALRIIENKRLIKIVPKGGIFVSGLKEDELRSIQVFHFTYHKDPRHDHLHREAQQELGRLLSAKNYSMVLSFLKEGQTVAEVVQRCGVTPAMRNGVIFMGYIPSDEDILCLREYQVPIVMLGLPRGKEKISSCGADGYLAVKMSLEHLIDHGHRRIATLVNRNDPRFLDVVIKTLKARQLEYCPELVLDVLPWSFEDGANAVKSLLEKGIAFSGIVCFGDQAMLGALNAAVMAGLNMPEDFALVVCGSSMWCRQMPAIQLTGAWQDIPALMGKIVELLELERRGNAERIMHWIPPLFKIAGSCGCNTDR